MIDLSFELQVLVIKKKTINNKLTKFISLQKDTKLLNWRQENKNEPIFCGEIGSLLITKIIYISFT